MKEVTDPQILEVLNRGEVRDESILSQLEGKVPEPSVSGALPEDITMLSEPREMPETGKSMPDFMKNFLKSLGWNALMATPAGIYKGVSDIQEASKDTKQVWENVRSKAAEVFSSPESFIKHAGSYIYEDPVGAAAAVGMPFSPFGKSTIPGKIARATEPLHVAQKTLATAAATVIPERIERRLMASALKPTNVNPKQLDEMIDTMFSEGLTLGRKGWLKKEVLLGELRDKVDDIISNSPINQTTGAQIINKRQMLQELKDWYTSTSYGKDPTAEFDTPFNRIINKMDRNTKFPDNMTIAQANDMKLAIQNVVAKAYGDLSTINKETKKSLGHILRIHMEDLVPEISAPNARMSAIHKLEEYLANEFVKEQRGQLFSLTSPVYGSVGKTLTGSPEVGIAAWVGKSLLESGPIKSQVAHIINQVRTGESRLYKPYLSKTRRAAWGTSKIGEQYREQEQP